jgi:hypothetical protein
MRPNGSQIDRARPVIDSTGIGPNAVLSWDMPRLSPNTNTCPAGTYTGTNASNGSTGRRTR